MTQTQIELGDPEMLERLSSIAPTIAVRGNVDTGPWAQSLPLSEVVEVGDIELYVLHEVTALDLDKAAEFSAREKPFPRTH